jgi:hypothetical protein
MYYKGYSEYRIDHWHSFKNDSDRFILHAGEKAYEINKHGKGWYTMEGRSDYIRVGMTEDTTEVAYIDPQGGPFLHVGDDFEKLGKIVSLIQEDSGKEEFFKIRIEVEQ